VDMDMDMDKYGAISKNQLAAIVLYTMEAYPREHSVSIFVTTCYHLSCLNRDFDIVKHDQFSNHALRFWSDVLRCMSWSTQHFATRTEHLWFPGDITSGSF
jgi:hypothetical protein